MYLIIILLFVMTMYQIILQTDANIRKNLLQIGILRAMGLKIDDVSQIIMAESLVTALSAVICGFTMAWAQAYVCVKGINQIFEQPFYYPVEWLLLVALLIVTFVVNFIGTSVAVRRIRFQSVASIVKFKA